MPGDGSPTARRRRLAEELHRLRREETEYTGDQVADELGWSPSKISRIENARSGLSLTDTRRLLDCYGVTGTRREELINLAREAARKGWWEAYSDDLYEELIELIGMEAEAASAWNWEPQVVPGLLQTEGYARAVIGSWQEWAKITPSAVDRRVDARLARKQRITGDNPMRLWAVMDESVLFRQFGKGSVMREQLQHLIDISQRDNVTLKILSLRGKQPVSTGAFVYFKFPQVHNVMLDDIVVLEQHTQSYLIRHRDDVYQYELAFDAVFSESLVPPRSRDVIARAIKTWS